MYTELHARSAFSFLEGAALPEDLAAVGHNQGMNAMALLDRDGVYGAPRFNFGTSPSRCGSHFIGGLALSAARRITLGLPESLPFNYAHEITR